eukprot:jgi/Mesen1/4856/ME000244S04035
MTNLERPYMTIEDLPDDCLLNIFRRLTDGATLQALSLASHRCLQMASAAVTCLRFNSRKRLKRATLDRASLRILQELGVKLMHLQLSCWSSERISLADLRHAGLLRAVGSHCPDLVDLRFRDQYELQVGHLAALGRACPRVRLLAVERLHAGCRGEIYSLVESFPSLQYLHVGPGWTTRTGGGSPCMFLALRRRAGSRDSSTVRVWASGTGVIGALCSADMAGAPGEVQLEVMQGSMEVLEEWRGQEGLAVPLEALSLPAFGVLV